MKIIDGLPYYSWNELDRLVKSLPPNNSLKDMIGGNKISFYNYWMNSYKVTCYHYIKTYFEEEIDNSSIETAQRKLEKSIKYNMNYLKEKHCKI